MPPNLRKVHPALGRAVDNLYRPGGFNSERDRLECRFLLYEQMMASLMAKPKR